jgi:hypothetical protein
MLMDARPVRRKRADTVTAESRRWPKLQTSVPPHVRERYVQAARKHGISLALYLEKLSDRIPELRDAAPAPKDPEHT